MTHSFCGSCGNRLAERDTFCGVCGHAVLAPPSAAQRPSPPTGTVPPAVPAPIPPPVAPPSPANSVVWKPAGRRRRRRVWIIAAAGALAVIGVTAALVLPNGDDGGSTIETTDPSTDPAVSTNGATTTSESSSSTSTATSTTASPTTIAPPTSVPPSLVTIAPVPVPTTASTTTTTTLPRPFVIERRCVRANIDFAAVREAPGVEQLELGRIPPSTCNVEVYATGSDGRILWLQVGFGGLIGWSADSNFVSIGG